MRSPHRVLSFAPAPRVMLLAVALLAACAPSAAQPPENPSAPSPGSLDLTPGAHVFVARQGQWYAATVLQSLADGRFVIHYDNAGNEWNEPVGKDRIRPDPASGPAKDYRAGEMVLVTAQGRRMLAQVVVQLAAEQWRVHFDGYGPDVVESAGPARMSRPFLGVSAHAVGESLLVDVNGTVLPAKVIATTSQDKWLVRFDGFAPQYDQEITAERLRPPPAPAAPPMQIAAAAPEPRAAQPPAGAPAVGEAVLVAERGRFFPATVTAVSPTGLRVKFASRGGGDDDVSFDRVVRDAPLKGLRYRTNQPVLVEYHGVFVSGKVLKEEGNSFYKIRFDGYGADADELVAAKRLRPR